MSQKFFNHVVGILFIFKAITVGYYLLTGIRVVAFFGEVAGWVEALVIIFCLGYAFLAFEMKKKQYVPQKIFNRVFGILSGLDALISLYYLIFSVQMVLGNQVFPSWLLVFITMLDIYLFYTAFSLAKKIQ